MTNRYADVSGIVTGLANAASSVATPLNQLDAALVAMEDGDSGFTQVNMGEATELTISDGAITITGSHHTVDTEGDASSDVLSTIYGGSEGDVLYLRLANAGRTVRLEHGTGNIALESGVDYTLTSVYRVVKLFHNGTYWADSNGASESGEAVFETILGWTELESAAASVNISSIPSDYRVLVLRVAARSADTGSDLDDLLVLLNNDTTAANYRGSLERIDSSVSSSTNNQSFAGLYGGLMPTTTAPSGYLSVHDITLHNVVSDRPKPMVFEGHVLYDEDVSIDMAAVVGGGLWLNAADLISTITLQTSSGENLAAATAYALYGVR
jgi:hypothetical protein